MKITKEEFINEIINEIEKSKVSTNNDQINDDDISEDSLIIKIKEIL
jgi:hypothetical protein